MTQSLNREQAAALKAVQNGKNIFLTGAGGTGKTHTIRAIVDWAYNAGIRYAVTAMTGCAALLLNTGHYRMGAKTLHSWGGIGLARESATDLAASVARNKFSARRWADTQLLIVDEVSMMTPDLLEKLDAVARRVRKRSDKRMGGIQLILAGDFCQLPPVMRGVSSEEQPLVFGFESPVWKTLIDETCELVQLQRQTDPVFQQLLAEARMGALTAESIKVLEGRMGLPWQDNEIRPTLLFNRNAEVDAINRRNMDVLEGERRMFEVETVIIDKATKKVIPYNSADAAIAEVIDPSHPDVQTALDRLDTDSPYDKKLELCVGAQVMLLVNLDPELGLVNGSRGVLTGYTAGGHPVVRFLSTRDPVIVTPHVWNLADYEGIGRSQIPLKVAYAITIHRSQGATLDSALVDIGTTTFEYGQAYVALSRVRSLEGLYVWKLDPRRIRCHPKVIEFYELLTASRSAQEPEPTVANGGGSEDPVTEPIRPWIVTGLSPAWRTVIDPFLAGPQGVTLQTRIEAITTAGVPVVPNPEDVFAALRACSDPKSVRVIILGQDPYPTAGNAHGLSFSVRPGVKVPASLQNIYKELESDVGVRAPTTGNLQAWADQGVLLLNDVLTVTIGAPQSHAGFGWEELTTRLLARALEAAPHAVLIAWGRPAQKKLENREIRHLVQQRGHTVLTAPHPSPLSARTGFFGSRPFSQTNADLVAHGLDPIRWAIPT